MGFTLATKQRPVAIASSTSRAGTFFPKQKFLNQNGDTISVKDFKGKYVLIDFWFAGCKPCRMSMEKFAELSEEYGGDLVVISYNDLDDVNTQKSIYFGYNQNKNPNWHFGHPIDPQYGDNLVTYYAITEYPSYFLLDKEGMIINEPFDGSYGVHTTLGIPLFGSKLRIPYFMIQYKGTVYFSLIIYVIVLALIFLWRFFKRFQKN
jgi:thiol-disulfide isomerase/thioredoxin